MAQRHESGQRPPIRPVKKRGDFDDGAGRFLIGAATDHRGERPRADCAFEKHRLSLDLKYPCSPGAIPPGELTRPPLLLGDQSYLEHRGDAAMFDRQKPAAVRRD